MPKRLLRKFLLILVGAVVIALGISLFRATTATVTFQYAVTDLGVLPGYTQSFPKSLNDKGQIVGYSSTSNNSSHAFLWESGKMTDLGVLNGYDNSSAVDINNKGQVVGTLSGSNSSHAFLWQDSKMIDLGTLNGAKNSEAVAINKAGQVVGNSGEGFGDKIFLWQKGLMQTVHIKDQSYPSGQVNVSASDINNLGQIAATSQFRNSWHPLLSKNGVVTSFDKYFFIRPCPGPPKINNNGQLIVSGSTDFTGAGDCSAFLGTNGKLVNLGDLGGTGAVVLVAAPYGINDLGRVVGTSFINNTGNKFGTYHAFIWYNDKMRDLNSFLPTNSGWELTEARGINNKGQIIGLGKYNGQQKAFLLTPMRVTQ